MRVNKMHFGRRKTTEVVFNYLKKVGLNDYIGFWVKFGLVEFLVVYSKKLNKAVWI